MKYLSIDLETTGVDRENDQILSIGVVIEDTTKKLPVEDLPRLHLVIDRDRIEGHPFALNMNKDIIEIIRDYQISSFEDQVRLQEKNDIKIVKEGQVVQELFKFLYTNEVLNPSLYGVEYGGHMEMHNGQLVPSLRNNNIPQSKLTCAGKNFGTFDKLFLERLPRWKQVFQIHQRILDPAILYMQDEDETLPNLKTCKERAGISGEVTHDAIQDSYDVIKVIRYKLG